VIDHFLDRPFARERSHPCLLVGHLVQQRLQGGERGADALADLPDGQERPLLMEVFLGLDLLRAKCHALDSLRRAAARSASMRPPRPSERSAWRIAAAKPWCPACSAMSRCMAWQMRR